MRISKSAEPANRQVGETRHEAVDGARFDGRGGDAFSGRCAARLAGGGEVSAFVHGFLFTASGGCVAMWLGLLVPPGLAAAVRRTAAQGATRTAAILGVAAVAFVAGCFAVARYALWRYQEALALKGDIPLSSEITPAWVAEPIWPVIFAGVVFALFVLSVASRRGAAG